MLSCNARAELAKRNLIDFVTYCKDGYQVNWHHQLLCDYLDKFARGEIRRLMVFIPPQHGKSELVSRNLPAFILGRNPKAKIVLASYSADLSSSFNRDCQRIIDGEKYHEVFPDTRLSSSNVVAAAKGSWLRNSSIFETVDHGGFLKTVGVGGSLTGTPADFAIIDDPVKDSIEAMSPTYQFRTWNWFNDVLYTRIHNVSGILVTQTRWDVNDLSGKLLAEMEKGGEQWTVLSLPAVKTPGGHPEDPRQDGEALWPERHGIDKLDQVRRQSIRTFEALYQQNPKPIQAGGEFWKGFNVTQHVVDISYCGGPLHIAVDENVNPYVTLALWQITEKLISQVGELPCVEPHNNAVRAADKLADHLYSIDFKSVLYVYGDPSAGKRSTVDRNNDSFFDVFIRTLRNHGFNVVDRVGRSAPEVAVSALFINSIYQELRGEWRIQINSRCPVSIEDYYTVKEDAEGGMVKIKRKDPTTGVTYEPYGHFSDAKRYFITQALADEFNAFKSRRKRRGSIAVPMT